MCGFKPLSFALSFFFILGMALLGIGIATFVIQTLNEPLELTTYNKMATEWNSGIRNKFSSFKFNFTDFYSNTTSFTDKNEDEDAFNREHKNIFVQYSPLSYEASGKDFMSVPKVSIRPFNFNPIFQNLNIKISSVRCQDRCIEKDIDEFDVPLFTLKVWPGCNRGCCSGKGIFRSETCYMLNMLTKFCVKVDYDYSRDKWILDYNYGTNGCFEDEKYREIGVLYDTNPNYTMTVDFEETEFIIRHAKDPLLYVYNVTNKDTSSFPLGNSLTRLGTIYLGIGSTGIGILIAVLSLGVCITLCLIPKYRKEYIFVNITEEHEFLLRQAESQQFDRSSFFSFPSNSPDDETHGQNKNL